MEVFCIVDEFGRTCLTVNTVDWFLALLSAYAVLTAINWLNKKREK